MSVAEYCPECGQHLEDSQDKFYPWTAPDGTTSCCAAHWAKKIWPQVQELQEDNVEMMGLLDEMADTMDDVLDRYEKVLEQYEDMLSDKNKSTEDSEMVARWTAALMDDRALAEEVAKAIAEFGGEEDE
jgi:Mg2+ and Co2+ transporter CorA